MGDHSRCYKGTVYRCNAHYNNLGGVSKALQFQLRMEERTEYIQRGTAPQIPEDIMSFSILRYSLHQKHGIASKFKFADIGNQWQHLLMLQYSRRAHRASCRREIR